MAYFTYRVAWFLHAFDLSPNIIVLGSDANLILK